MILKKNLLFWLLWITVTLVIPIKAYPGSSSNPPPASTGLRIGLKVIKVGSEMSYTRPSEAAKVAKDGDVIEIMAGTYMYDVAVWRQNNLTIRGVDGRAHLKADGTAAEGKAIWVIKGNNTIVENIEFSGARVRDKNGAGIRQEGSGLTIRRCYFHDNENGILAGRNKKSDIVIEYSEFANNGAGDGRSHNIYIGNVHSFTLFYSYVHHAKIGHNVKSRAQENYIMYNRLMDEETGSSSFIVDLSNGGTSYLIGNLIQQGPMNDNSTLVAYANEGESNPSSGFYVVNNTFVNNHRTGTYIKNSSKTTSAKLVNNIFASVGDRIIVGREEVRTISPNLVTDEPGFVNAEKFNYRLTSSSPAIDAGIDPGSANGYLLTPRWQYRHIAGREKRIIDKTIDIGAYEFGGH